MEKERRPNATASRVSPTTPISPRLNRRDASTEPSPFEETPRPCDVLRKRRSRWQTAADRRDGKTTQENITRLR
ncbi:MAG: hypothetical protein IJN32_08095 [Thermoguttaceae bacterium]|nr:hypothetical protein [Thermoguttaceae bacterium]